MRARDFLPQMATANATLEERLQTETASSLDIENTEGYDGPLIEMVGSSILHIKTHQWQYFATSTSLMTSDGTLATAFKDELTLRLMSFWAKKIWFTQSILTVLNV